MLDSDGFIKDPGWESFCMDVLDSDEEIFDVVHNRDVFVEFGWPAPEDNDAIYLINDSYEEDDDDEDEEEEDLDGIDDDYAPSSDSEEENDEEMAENDSDDYQSASNAL